MDPLGDLCLAAIEDAEQENRVDNRESFISKDLEGKVPSTSNALVILYRDQCTRFEVQECWEHVRLLEGIPHELIIDSCDCQSMLSVPGGAVIRLDSSCDCAPGQVAALLTTIAPPRDSPVVTVVDTLDVSGVPIPSNGLSEMIQNAMHWGPWWRLRCLVLRNCALDIEHINLLGSIDAVPCFWNLEYLDVSQNHAIGRDLSTGLLRDPTQFASPDVAFLVHLWKQAKLRYLNIECTNLTKHVLRCLMMVLAEYHVSEGELGCGFAPHQGSRASLEALIVGDLCGSSEVDRSLIDVIVALTKQLPSFSYFKVGGLSQDTLLEISTAWEGVPSATCGIIVEEDILRRSSFDVESIQPPSDHILMSKCVETPEDMHNEPAQNLPQQILDDFGLNQILCRKDNEDTDKMPILQPSHQLDQYNLSTVGVQKPPKSSEVQRDTRRAGRERSIHGRNVHCRSSKLYAGGDRYDVLPMEEIDVMSEPGAPESHDNTQEESEDMGHEHRSQPEDMLVPAASDRMFRLRDGMLDEDSKLGKIYRTDTRKKLMQIPDEDDQRAAKRAFKLWDQCTENSWDRRRWDNPSKTQNDEPHILGQLNLLFDILDKYKLHIGFPFPGWRKGQGEAAFETRPNDTDAVHGREKRSPSPVSYMSLASDLNAESPMNQDEPRSSRAMVKSRPILLSDDDDDEEEEEEEEEECNGIDKEPVLACLDDNKEGRELPCAGTGQKSRQSRELCSLSAWAWDHKRDDHPPNESVYGPATGKRQRRQVVSDVVLRVDETEACQADAREFSDEEDVPLLYRMGVIPESQESVE